jgi:predicted dehydrogenase
MSDDYGLAKQTVLREIPAPELPSRPRNPRAYQPGIGIIGCGGIASHHLAAYQRAGYRVVALCGREETKPRALRDRFYPDAEIFTDYRELLRRPEIQVVDITTYPLERVPIIEAALAAGKHVLSQKPFVEDLAIGAKLVEQASARGVKLAVNQNGRWAPHFRYALQAIRHGLLGEVASVSFALNWDHTWIAGTPFDEVHHLILGDFAIHWFDLIAAIFGGREWKTVAASVERAPEQSLKPPMMAHALVEYDRGQATLALNGVSQFGQSDRTVIVGTRGALHSSGPSLTEQEVTLFTAEGVAKPTLHGTWFTEGFHGTMGELLCAIEEGREPENSAARNLRSLALCFAAMKSADHAGRVIENAELRTLG